MSETVFVIHGVGNRDRAGFEKRVADLHRAVGEAWDMKAVYWGDLGADDRVDLKSGSAPVLLVRFQSDYFARMRASLRWGDLSERETPP